MLILLNIETLFPPIMDNSPKIHFEMANYLHRCRFQNHKNATKDWRQKFSLSHFLLNDSELGLVWFDSNF